jgi:hypothetical protein
MNTSKLCLSTGALHTGDLTRKGTATNTHGACRALIGCPSRRADKPTVLFTQDGSITASKEDAMLKDDFISIAEYSQLDRQRCAAYTTTLIALCYAYEAGRITHIRKKELEAQLRTDWKSVYRPERIKGFIAWCAALRKELEA